ncbi:hypothetical protein JP75_06610 [Devosia riboflavina]|uniref:Uncharacterized protein n=1 Tax=Devosia riboflavina TaxID=46914 RepID=A0A087M4D0_9HYPH|nr:hypothetical protein [Devosia riboflavina]KFL31733.1 hypothetical protein JP75_06610 [Devosia riboflavina]
MSLFADLETLVSAHVDVAFGDPVTHYPRRRGEISGSADPTRSIVTVVGVVDFNPRTVTPKGKEQFDAFQPNLMGEKVHVSFDENAFPGRDARPRQGDRLVAELKTGTFTFEVVTTEPDELGRFVCPCKVLGNGVIL